MYINEILFREHGIVFADTFDASIVYVKEPIRMYELELADIWTEVNIANARERLLERFKSLIRKPLEFDRYKGELLLAGVDVYKLIHGIQVSNTDMVRHAYKNAEVKVGSGAIINEGGRMDGRRSGIKAK